MILVKCTHCDKIADEAKPCIMLVAELVRPIKTEPNDGDDVEWEAVTWFNDTEKLLPNYPGPDKRLGLVLHPHGTVPAVIADEHGVSGAWGLPLFLYFYINNMQADLPDCVGKIYSVEVVGAK